MSYRILLALVGLPLILLLGSATEPPPGRSPWTTSKVIGSPEPPPKYKIARAFPTLKFEHPLLLTRGPDGSRLFIGEERGKIFSFIPGPNAKPELFLEIRKDVSSLAKTPGADEFESVRALAFHPQFKTNRYCYVCYLVKSKKTENLDNGSRIVRYVVSPGEIPRIDPASETILFTFMQGGHNGCDMHFGNDGYLYFSTGDAASPNPPDPFRTGQDVTDVLSSILRIDVDRTEAGKYYAIPADNPFIGLKIGEKLARPEVWAYGFRNPWRMSFDRTTGQLWVGDVGWEQWESIHKVDRGYNGGWSVTEARQPLNTSWPVGPTPIRPPAIELPHTMACSVTGGYVYRGKKFPELVGTYIFGDWETRRIWAARFDGDRLLEMPDLAKPSVRIVSFGEDKDNELYFLDYDGGTVHTLERNEATAANLKFPTRLSESGLFASTVTHSPASGVVRFKPNSHQWQDGATAEHFVALPGTSSVSLFKNGRSIPGQVEWHKFAMQFPPDAVLVKTISLQAKRIETQLLHFDGEDWRGYTFAWRDDQTDADLVPSDGAEKSVPVNDPRVIGGRREQVWTYASRSQCLTCHNAWAEYALAFNVGQLNGGVGENQLVRFTRDGLIRRLGDGDKPLSPFDASTVAKEPRVANPADPAVAIEARARGYLHANCAHCHRFGGGGGSVVLELDASKQVKEMGLIDVLPRQGDFGIPNAKLVVPGDTARSVLYYRMAKFGKGRMPHAGAEWPDPAGLALIDAWIAKLGNKQPLGVACDAMAGDGIGGSLRLARGFADGCIPDGDRSRLLTVIAAKPPGVERDLFDGYLPPDPKGRKLGPNPRPTTILGLTGDATRGETIFHAKETKCASCHKIGDKGVTLGPDLTTIGKIRTRVELLESLLDPSRRIEPQFASYLVRTHDGRTFTGLIAKRDGIQTVLRDGENKEIVLASGDVEAVQPSRLSLMPDGLLAGLTPQEAADLLAFLASRK